MEERARDAPVEPRRQRHDQRLGREDPARDEARVAPAVRSRDLALEQSVRDPILLAQAGAGNDPLDVAAEAEEPDAVALAEIGLGQRGGRAHGVVERARRARRGGSERIEEDDDVGAPLGQPIVDEQPAARGGRTPVDSPGTLAGGEEPELRELDAFAGDRSRSAAGHRACRPRPGEPSQPLHRRVDPQRRGRLDDDLGSNGGEADRVPRAGSRRCGRRPSEGS